MLAQRLSAWRRSAPKRIGRAGVFDMGEEPPCEMGHATAPGPVPSTPPSLDRASERGYHRAMPGRAVDRRAPERAAWWMLIGLVLLVALAIFRGGVRDVGRRSPGFALMVNGQTGAGGFPRAGLEPLDVILAVDGRPGTTAAGVQAEGERHPPGTPPTHVLRRGVRHQRVEAVVPTRALDRWDLLWLVVDGIVPGLLVLGLGAFVLYLRPGTPESRLFLAFCLVTGTVNLTYMDLMSAGPFTRLFLGAWPVPPPLPLHPAAAFPHRRPLADPRPPRGGAAAAASAALMAFLQVNFMARRAPIGEIVALYTALAALALIASLAWTARAGRTPLARRRARVLLWGFGVGYVAPMLGATFEVV